MFTVGSRAEGGRLKDDIIEDKAVGHKVLWSLPWHRSVDAHGHFNC